MPGFPEAARPGFSYQGTPAGHPEAAGSGAHPELPVLRRHGTSRGVADLIWANIGRVTGTIICRERSVLYVEGSDGLAPRAVMIPRRSSGQIQVRFPRLEPGYLVDLIGIRRDGYVEGLVPATSQPAYRVDHVPAAPLVNGHLPGTMSGAAVWHEPGTARLFCDRSVTCGPSPRGRIADLTVASFVELGGELDRGSFNATIQVEV